MRVELHPRRPPPHLEAPLPRPGHPHPPGVQDAALRIMDRKIDHLVERERPLGGVAHGHHPGTPTDLDLIPIAAKGPRGRRVDGEVIQRHLPEPPLQQLPLGR